MSPVVPARPLLESLEPRHLFSTAPLPLQAQPVTPVDPVPAEVVAANPADTAGPQLLGVRVLGSPFRATAIELTFSEPLDPDRAEDRDSYLVAGRFIDCGYVCVCDCCGCSCFGDDFCDEDIRLRLPIDEATYDEAARTVTLFPTFRFSVRQEIRVIKVRSGENGVLDAAGNRLDGDNDGAPGGMAVLRFRTSFGRSVRYTDADGDQVRLRLSGGGNVFVLQQLNPRRDPTTGGRNVNGGNAIQVWLTDRVSARSTLTGTITPTRRGGDGTTTIRELLQTFPARLTLLAQEGFSVGAVVS